MSYYYDDSRQHNIIPCDNKIVEKAKLFGIQHNLAKNGFSYSRGWLEKFKKRYHISDDGGGQYELNMVRQRSRLMKNLNHYSPEDVFCLDETPLYYKLDPGNYDEMRLNLEFDVDCRSI